jgi:hypothetical protein
MPGMHVDMDGQRDCELFYQVVIVFLSVRRRMLEQKSAEFIP